MTSAFRFLEDIALADSAFEARGTTPSELFTASAQALIETLADPATVAPAVSRSFTRHDRQLPDLLFDWLADLVFLKDAEGMVFHDAACTVTEDRAKGEWRLTGTVTGEPIDPRRHDLRADVKAVTKHRYAVRQGKGDWVATVVLDI
jgi:SHS2 domain-containing protein